MFDLFYDFYITKLFNGTGLSNSLSTSLFGETLTLNQYFSLIASFVSVVFILVLSCLFVKKIIQLIYRLFSGGGIF